MEVAPASLRVPSLAALLFSSAACVAVVGLVALLVERVAGDVLLDLDRELLLAAQRRAAGSDVLFGLNWVVSFMGSTAGLIAVVVVVSLLLGSRRDAWASADLLIVFALGGSLVSRTIKEIVGRARPEWADPIMVSNGYSFPSGHALNSTVVYGAIVLIVGRRAHWTRLAAGASVLVSLIAVSRVFLGVHYPTDVVAGIALGSAWLAPLAVAYRRDSFGWGRAERGGGGLHDGAVPDHVHKPAAGRSLRSVGPARGSG
jgi:undecaprenyl-diphosphatase